MREQAAADFCAQGLGRHVHAALHHVLRHADAPQERRFSPLVGSGDDDDIFAVRFQIVADHGPVHAESKAHVAKPGARMFACAERIRNGKGDRHAFLGELAVEVHAPEIEGQFSAERL